MNNGDEPNVINALTLAATPTAVPISRALVRLSLTRWGFRELIDDAELLVSELTTNAIRAASTTVPLIRVAIKLTLTTVRLNVWDNSEDAPLPVRPDAAEEGGRGLMLVDAISADWGWTPLGRVGGKVVWAELKLPHEPISPHSLPVLVRVRDGLKRL